MDHRRLKRGSEKRGSIKNEGVEIAGVEISAPDYKGGNHGSGNRGIRLQGWKSREWKSRYQKAGVENLRQTSMESQNSRYLTVEHWISLPKWVTTANRTNVIQNDFTHLYILCAYTCLCLPSRSWYSFTDPGWMEG